MFNLPRQYILESNSDLVIPHNSNLSTISCNSKPTAYSTADNSKLSTPVLNLISDSGHNSQFLLPTVPRQKTITEDSHSRRMRMREMGKKGCSRKAKRKEGKHKQRTCPDADAERKWTETTESNSVPLTDRRSLLRFSETNNNDSVGTCSKNIVYNAAFNATLQLMKCESKQKIYWFYTCNPLRYLLESQRKQRS